MGSDPLAPVLVPNRYRVAVMMTKHASGSDIDDLQDLLEAAMKAFEAGAWEGGLADDCHGRLLELRDRAQAAAARCEGELDYAIAGQALEVPVDSWQARWNRYGVTTPWLW